MGKKGLSLEDKRQKILQIYYEKKEVFNLKEIEKYGAKKGVVPQTIKDVNQSLVDDNLVETDKIGAGAFFWALPSKGFQQRQNLISNLEKHTEEVKVDIEKQKQKIEHEKSLRQSENGNREALLEELKELRKENSELSKKLSLYEKCDPKKLEEIENNKQICLNASNRWTDNLFEVQSWIKKNNPGITDEALYENFEILKDLDYVMEPKE